MNWDNYFNKSNKCLVAGHRGERFLSPENTLTAFKRAIDYGVDMIETDVRMTKDHEIVIMHDEGVERTTDGVGLVKEMTLAEFQTLNAANGFEKFPREAPPTLEAFLDLVENNPKLLINVELKDYPQEGNEKFAYESADKTIALIERYNLGKRSVLNSFSGKLLEYIEEKYPKKYLFHGFYPYPIMGETRIKPSEYLYCACIFPVYFDEKGNKDSYNYNVPPKNYFKKVIDDGVMPWVGAGIRGRKELLKSIEYGAKLITTDYPEDVLTMLREEGLHD